MLQRTLAILALLMPALAFGQEVFPGRMKVDGAGNVSGDGKVRERISPAEQLKEFAVAKGFTVELVAAEPDIINPVALTVDDQGRMLVSESHTYRYGPSGSPVKPFKNPVVRLEPRPNGGFERVVLADGFDDPVMGIAVKGDKLWVTANNYLYRFDYPASGPATNKTLLVKDRNKAWNPFGMFVLEFAPDGLLYLSVGDHKVELLGPPGDGKTNTITSRGTSGVIVRMEPDGTQMQRLTQGFRVPYSFEFDPFGQLWLLSNGEGNPNRFARIIPGVDYHCYTRPRADNAWLAGNHPLAPPTLELPRGAHTQLLRYYSSAYPADFDGSLLLDNWGAHGFHGPNRGLFRYVPDERGHIVSKECFIACNDPHFRPAHVTLDHEGNLLIADWYGKDDESDLTGRIWRVRSTTPAPAERVAVESLEALGSRNHRTRQAAVAHFVAAKKIEALGQHAATSTSAMGAAHALWALRQIGASAREALLGGMKNQDPRVRRLALDLARLFGEGDAKFASAVQSAAQAALKDADAAVRVEAAITLATPDALVAVATGDVAKDRYLRYQTAAALAKNAGPKDFARLLASDAADVRLLGMMALDVALYEKTPSQEHAREAAGSLLLHRDEQVVADAIVLVQQHGDARMIPYLEKALSRDDISPASLGKALVVYRGVTGKLPPAAGKRFLEGVEKGAIKLATPADQAALVELLEAEGPTPIALELLVRQAKSAAPQVKPATLALARRFGPKAAPIADAIWPVALHHKAGKAEDALDALATIAVVEPTPSVERWSQLLDAPDPAVRTDAVRWFRQFKKHPELAQVLVKKSADLVKADAGLADDLASVFKELGVTAPGIPPDDAKRDRAQLAKDTASAIDSWPAAERQNHALLGKQVFERSLCTKCHTTVTQNTPLAPSLKGIAAQKLEYLIESILEPSKIIKTGFETEVITTTAGKTLSGLVKDEGTHFRVQNFNLDVRIPKTEVEDRFVQKLSIMPDQQETQMSRREFIDLIAYLTTLK